MIDQKTTLRDSMERTGIRFNTYDPRDGKEAASLAGVPDPSTIVLEYIPRDTLLRVQLKIPTYERTFHCIGRDLDFMSQVASDLELGDRIPEPYYEMCVIGQLHLIGCRSQRVNTDKTLEEIRSTPIRDLTELDARVAQIANSIKHHRGY